MFRAVSLSGSFSHMLPTVAVQQQSRNMATLKDISLRLKSVKNIQKITKSMKMIAGVKFNRADRELKAARPYGIGAQAFYEQMDLSGSEVKPEHLVICISSDRGLCGSIHSTITKAVRAMNEEKPADRVLKLVVVGDKCRAQLQRTLSDNIVMSCNEVGRKPPSFGDATKVALAILDSGISFDQGEILYNKFRTVVSFRSTSIPLYSLSSVTSSENISKYDSLDDDVVQNYMEYSMASLLYYAMMEGACSEQSSRMTAMEAASKNAGEMIDKLTMLFNRTRQAVITRELIEIISGAAAV